MKIITAPSLHVAGVTQFIPDPDLDYQIPDDGDDFTKLGAYAAKGCYDSYSKTGRPNRDNQIAVMESVHGSVLEHLHVSIRIAGITRALSLEMNRHRPFNISQRSTRYTKEGDAGYVLEPYFATLFQKYVTPLTTESIRYIMTGFTNGETDLIPKGGLTETERLEAQLLEHHCHHAGRAMKHYEFEVERLEGLNPLKLTGFDLRKWARGKARNLLPHGLETRGLWTNNLRGWRWFIELRSEEGAEPEIRRLADALVVKLKVTAPLYMEDFTVSKMHDGIPVWVPLYKKI